MMEVVKKRYHSYKEGLTEKFTQDLEKCILKTYTFVELKKMLDDLGHRTGSNSTFIGMIAMCGNKDLDYTIIKKYYEGKQGDRRKDYRRKKVKEIYYKNKRDKENRKKLSRKHFD